MVNFATLVFFFFAFSLNVQSQCIPSPAFGGASNGAAGNIFITTAKFNATTFYSGGTVGANPYTNLSGSVTGNVTAGLSYTLNLVSSAASASYYTCYYAWIDWNNNGIFTDAGENVLAITVPNPGALNVTSGSFTVGAGLSGNVRMRVAVMGGGIGSIPAIAPCAGQASYYGEFKDFTCTITPGTPCSGTPASLAVSPAAPSICSAAATTIALTLDASGYTYQWQQANAAGGSYVNVTSGSGGTTAIFTTPTGSALPYNPTYYRCNVTCTASGLTTASQISTVSLNSFLNCYCTPTFAVANGGTRGVTNVTLNGTPTINNTTTCNNVSPYYSLYTAASPVSNAGLTAGSSYTLNVKVGTQATTAQHRGAAWIDYNQNGIFETTEYLGTFGPLAANAIAAIAFTVPAGATSGTTAMRVIGRFGTSGTVTNAQACAAFTGTLAVGGSGECEDYRVVITASCTAPTTQASAFVTDPSPTTNSCSVKFTRGNGNGGMIVVCKAGSAPTAPVPGTAYSSPNANITAGGSTTAAGSFVIYNSNTPASGQVTVPATNLTPNTTYYFAAYEWNATGNCYVLTSPANGTCVIPICLPPSVQPGIVTLGASTSVSQQLSWASNGDGDAGVTVFVKATSAIATDPSQNTVYTGNAAFGSGTQIGATGAYAVYNGSLSTITVSNLLPSTTYYYAIYTYNAAGPCFLEPTTRSGSFITASCSPTIQPSSPTISCISSTTLNLRFTRGNGNRAIVVARAGSAVNSDPVYNTAYTASAVFGGGSQIGAGNYVVYDGNDLGTVTVPLSGLNAGVTYYFKIYEYNGPPNCYNTLAPLTISGSTRNSGVYTSSTVTQNSTNVAFGALAQDIVKLTIVMGGGADLAATLNNIVFTTTGSTNTATDITNAKIFYTGSSNVFSNATQYGSTFTSFGTNTATANFALLPGNNYFWIAYDVKATATGGDVLDATVTSFNITDNTGTSNKIPTPTAPAGNRLLAAPVSLVYCSGVNPIAVGAAAGCEFSCSQGEYLTSITISGGSWQSFGGWPCTSSPCIDPNSYTDLFSSNKYILNQGGSYTMSINFYTWFSMDMWWCIWVDWGQDGVFTNGSPERFPATGSVDQWTSTAITVPASVSSGRHRARLWVQEFSYKPTTPCRTTRGPLTTSIGYIVDFDIEVPDGSLVDLDPVAVPGGVSCATLAPSITTPINYIQGDAASQLTATGTNLLWYTSPTGGAGSAIAPTPTTAATGTTTYYVSQTNASGSPICEGPRIQIAVNVNPAPPPTAPAATATQPTCAVGGIVDLSGLPSSGTWTINPGAISGTGTTYSISPVAVGGPYTYTCTNASGCISPVSNSVTINTPPSGTQGFWVGGVSTDWANTANWCAPIPVSTTDVFIPSSAPYMPAISTTAEFCHNLSIAAGGSLTITGGSLSLYGDLVNNGLYTHTAGSLIITGSAPQSTSGITVFDMTMNNASGLTINGNVIVNGLLTLTLGNITTGANEAQVSGNTGTEIINFSSASYINGNLRRNVTGINVYDYPVGSDPNYERITLSVNNLVGVSNILGLFNSAAPAIMTTPVTDAGTTYIKVWTTGYWTITPNSAPAGGDYGIKIWPTGYSWTATGHAVVKTQAGNPWDFWGSTRIDDDTRTGYTAFSNVAPAESNIPLPIELLFFSGQCEDENSILKWSTASETNNDYFTIYRSKNIIDWDIIGTVDGAGNSSTILDYSFTYKQPHNEVAYYCLKQTDFDNNFSYSDIIYLEN
ncbi:MAG: GEVED domain-containing protein, partial [Bacteroidota bacterium]